MRIKHRNLRAAAILSLLMLSGVRPANSATLLFPHSIKMASFAQPATAVVAPRIIELKI